MFNKEVYKRFPDFTKEFKEIEEYYEVYDNRYVGKTKPQVKPNRLLGHQGFHYLQLTLIRSRALFEGLVNAVNIDNPLMAILAVRAHFEVTGAVSYFYKKLLSFYNDKIDYEGIDSILYRLTFSTRDSEMMEYFIARNPDPNKTIKAISVLDLIDAADDLYKKSSGDKESKYRIAYEDLCEYCHPNFNGITLGVNIDKGNVARYEKLSKISKSELYIFILMNITLKTYINTYDNILSLLKEHEELPNIL
jgi:hypothetical protein